MNSEQTQIFQDFVQDSLQQALPDLKVTRVADPDHGDPIQWLDPIHVSIMRFHGDGMQGNSILACDLGFLERTCPHYDKDDLLQVQTLQDWVGELSNLILGRLKNKLLPFGTVLKLNPPSVTEATSKIFDLYATHSQSFKMWFSSDKDFICLSFSLDVSEGIDLHVSSTKDEGQLQPGDAIYRLTELPTKSYDMVSKVRSGVSLDEDSLPADDFEFDGKSEPDRLPRSRAEDQAPNWAQPASESIQGKPRKVEWVKPAVTGVSAEGFSAHTQLEFGTSSESRRALSAMKWLPSGELMLEFEGGLAYTLVPQKLLDAGWPSISVEAYQLQLTRTAHGVRVSISDLQMSIEQDSAA